MDLKNALLCFIFGAIVGGNFLVNGAVKFTNVKCESFDKKFCEFEYCYLKAVNRSYQYMSLKVVLHKIPIKDVVVNLSFSKRASGYRPFLYNITFDGCKFMRNTNTNQIAKFVYGVFKSFTNLNHTCPYDHDIIVDRMSTMQVNHHLTNVLPFPLGEYRIETNWYTQGIHRITMSVFINLF